jgi:hypothetical protein
MREMDQKHRRRGCAWRMRGACEPTTYGGFIYNIYPTIKRNWTIWILNQYKIYIYIIISIQFHGIFSSASARLDCRTVDANCHDAGTSLDPGKWGSGCRTGCACLEPWVLRMFWRYGKFLCSCVYIACHLTSFDHRNWQMQRADKCQMKGWEMQQLAPHSMDPTWSTGVAAAWFPLVPLDKPPKWLRREPMEPMVGLCWATFHFGLCNPCLDCRNWTLKENWAPEAKTSLEREWDREKWDPKGQRSVMRLRKKR